MPNAVRQQQFLDYSAHHSQYPLIISRKGIFFVRDDIEDSYGLPIFTPCRNSNSRMHWPFYLTVGNRSICFRDFVAIDDYSALKRSEAQTINVSAWGNSSCTYLM